MIEKTIRQIENTSFEYKSFAKRMTDIYERISIIASSCDPREHAQLEMFIGNLEEQIRGLSLMSDDLEEAADNYRHVYKAADAAEPRADNRENYEFGTSDFSNLSEYEHLIPISQGGHSHR